MLSPAGRSRMWDADADGYARGDGVAAVVLKTRQAAEADGDHIECIIRETAVGQDGRTPGQTMPSASAQAQLIRDCYRRAGLDPTNPKHRPQYFEAHGTGTQAGDPVEAEAISSAFFPACEQAIAQDRTDERPPLYVGSCKTVIGHTEGTAGLAGLLKASLALQNGIIAPNLLFHRLNPRIVPFYSHLQIPTAALPWPEVEQDTPRRVSVNSFGFGGTNAHAILESYTAPHATQAAQQGPRDVCLPFVFSANSEASLRAYLRAFADFLSRSDRNACDLDNVAYTLSQRRTRLPVATAITASSAHELRDKIDKELDVCQGDPQRRIGNRSSARARPQVLGIFTGQGAQWAQMGLDLVSKSTVARETLHRLQSRLDRLPPAERPAWSLAEEMRKDSCSTRVVEAAISQPLCTAIQILQVDLVRASGIQFSAVVGHSSGEIAAAYAAGLVSAEDAICIAYYRGLQSLGPHASKPGAMMAVGTSAEDAQDLLDFAEFQDRACIAAFNAPASITLSGDQDAIQELQVVLTDERKFTRLLRVDRAYHSHHMRAYSAGYRSALAALHLQIARQSSVPWFSSVDDRLAPFQDWDALKGPYWDENMVNPVRFVQAVGNACSSLDSLDLVIEVGPHPVLKGPVLQTLQGRWPHTVPYTGLFNRSLPDTMALADAVGYAWTHLGSAVDLQKYHEVVAGASRPALVTGLPGYVWDHENRYWHESRYARAIRMRPDAVHELIGHLTPDSTEHDMRWRHILRLSEMEWLAGHRLQDAIVFPGAGYIVSVLEACLILCRGTTPSLVEVNDVHIVSALVFDDKESNVEIILSLTDVARRDHSIAAEFKYHATAGRDTDELKLKACGRVLIHLGQPCDDALPARAPRASNLVPVTDGRFYAALLKLDYQYSGPFRALEGIERKLGAATGFISKGMPSSLLIHPGTLDAAFQSTFLTHVAPDDGGLRSIHVPKSIRNITFNPRLCHRAREAQEPLAFDATHSTTLTRRSLASDIDIFPPDSDWPMVQVQGIECVPFSQQPASEKIEVFSNMVWGLAQPDVRLLRAEALAADLDLVHPVWDQLATYYLHLLSQQVPSHHVSRSQGPYTNLVAYAQQVASATTCEQPSPEDIICAFSTAVGDHPSVKLLVQLGESIVDMVKSQDRGSSPPETILRGELLRDWYNYGIGVSTYTNVAAKTVKQIVHRYPHLHILDYCNETAATSSAIMQEIGQDFATYTVIGPAAGSKQPEDWPQQGRSDIAAKPADLSKDLVQQGFAEASYDLFVASFDFAAVNEPAVVLQNIRRVIKPGGYLVVPVPLPPLNPVFALILGALMPKIDSGPYLDVADWDSLLRKAGFSGLTADIANGTDDGLPFTVLVSRAVDDNIAFLLDPISSTTRKSLIADTEVESLLLLTGDATQAAELSEELLTFLEPYCHQIRTVQSLADISQLSETPPNTVMLSLMDYDGSLFEHLTEVKWQAIKKPLLHTGPMIWVTQGRLSSKPHSNMIQGLTRVAARENPTFDYLLLDLEDSESVGSTQPTSNARAIAESVLRRNAITRWNKRGVSNFLYSSETEITLDKQRRYLIPRLIMHEEMNDRYSSGYRTVRRTIKHHSKEESIVGVRPSPESPSGWTVQAQPALKQQVILDNATKLRTTHSMLSPVRVTEFGSIFLVLGKDEGSAPGEIVVALSDKHNSVLHVPAKLSVHLEAFAGSCARLLWLTFQHLVASTVLRGLSEEDAILVHDPSAEFAAIVAEQASQAHIRVTFTTTGSRNDTDHSQSSTKEGVSWQMLKEPVSQRELARLSRSRFSAFVDMTTQSHKHRSTGQRIGQVLPKSCRKDSLASILGAATWTPTLAQTGHIGGLLKRAVFWSLSALESVAWRTSGSNVPAISLASLSEEHGGLSSSTIIDWASGDSKVLVDLQPVDSLVEFAPRKTYWLAGLSGSLGLSLCEWMMSRGARYFVISSRRPDIQPAWLDEMHQKGAVVKICACDITSREQVRQVHAKVLQSMPPFGGIAQGAMILDDQNIQDMPLAQFQRAAQPKIQGSIYLNELFQENTLEFFIFFSSVSSMVGNHGQSNYGAANTFMGSLARQRRDRGLAASVIGIGAIAGVGYIARNSDDVFLGKIIGRTGGLVATSERDFHQLFGEAVLAGRPGSTRPIELVSGVRRFSKAEEQLPVWCEQSWPRMSHFITLPRAGNDVPVSALGSGAAKKLPIKAQLATVAAKEQVYDVILDGFSALLASYFQLNLEQMSRAELVAMRLDEMGIDSLVAVEIRGWFMKNLEVNIPVLKIMNGSSVGDLVRFSSENIIASRSPEVKEMPAMPVEDTEAPSPTTTIGSSIEDTETDTGADFDDSLVHEAEDSLSSDTESTSGSESSAAARPTEARLSVVKSVEVSFTQDRFYPSGLFLEDKVGLNHTAWGRFSDRIHMERLRQAIRTTSQQHEILRTAFFDMNGTRMQHILERGLLEMEYVQIQDESEVEKTAMYLQKEHVYDVANGKTMRFLLLSRSESENYLLIGVHPLIMDGTSIQIYLKWLAIHYDDPHNATAVKQFAESSAQRRADYRAGKFEPELTYWRREFATPPPAQPLLSLAKVKCRPNLKAYVNIRAGCVVDVQTKEQIREVCRRHRTTPFIFYLAALRALLLRYTASGGEDVTIAVAENGRGHDVQEMDVIGPLYNLVLVRLATSSAVSFENLLEASRDKTYAGLEHSKIPYEALVEELNLQRTAEYKPFFQIFADYRVGQQKTMPFGKDLKVEMMGFDLNIPYDLYLDTIDQTNGECLHELFVREDLFGKPEAERLARDFGRLIRAFATQPDIAVKDVDLS
ncbi:hypothetical protein BD289DRAFT_440531 [Coniella lustricola]|uniref:Uncharacterized protein n=1 Tax=Coniella lustricola TaxID=2025994 RepID=A0A2T3A0F3_9PEZI|nr:hypothetical protein BD289DRAFT_440531 [Coniella lustricola]